MPRSLTVACLLLLTACVAGAAPQHVAKKKPALPKSAHCYYDVKTLTWRIGNDAVERTVHFDRDTGSLRTLAIETKKPGARVACVSPFDGELTVTPEGGAARTIRLDGDWIFMFQIIQQPEHGGRTVTIHLHGTRKNDGYEVEAIYEAMPGDSPDMIQHLTLINRSASPVTVNSVTFDRWALLQEKSGKHDAPVDPTFRRRDDSYAGLTAGTNGGGLVACGIGSDISYENRALVARVRPNAPLGKGGARYTTPDVGVTVVFPGDPAGRQAVSELTRK